MRRIAAFLIVVPLAVLAMLVGMASFVTGTPRLELFTAVTFVVFVSIVAVPVGFVILGFSYLIERPR